MRKIRVPLLASLFAIGAASGASSLANEHASKLTLEEAARIALESSPAMLGARGILETRELELRNAGAAFLPSLDLSTIHGLSRSVIPRASGGSNEPWASQLSLGLSENLYDNGVSLTRREVARLARESAEVQFNRVRDQLVLDVAEEFYDLSLFRALLKIQEQQIKVLDKQLDSVNRQYRQGFKTKRDFVRLKTDVQRAQIDLEGINASIRSSYARLKSLLGTRADVSGFSDFETEEPTPDRALVSEIPSSAPSADSVYVYRIAEIESAANDRLVSLATRRYWPEVFLAGSVDYLNSDYLGRSSAFSAGHQLSWNVLLTVNYNIWDWGIRRRDVGIAAATRDIANSTLRTEVLRTSAEIEATLQDLGKLRANYLLNEELVTLEQETYGYLEADYRQGKVSYLDLITSLRSLLDSRQRFYSTHFEVKRKLALFRFYEGTLHQRLLGKGH